jgi:CRP-like cAMP-binding protein
MLMFFRKYREKDFFGERALDYLEPRAATIFSSTPCEFIILSKEIYDSIKKKVEETRVNNISEQLEKFPLFSSLSRKLKEKLS